MAIGLHESAGYYYYPGFHEPGTAQTLGINMRVWESFAPSDQRLITACAAAEYANSLAEFNANNASSLRKLRDAGTVRIVKFDDAMLKVFREIGEEIVEAAGTGSDVARKIYASYLQFRTSIMEWSDIADRAYLNSRRPV